MNTIKEIDNKKEWEAFLMEGDIYPYFQSWTWGEIQKRLGVEITRVGIYDEKKLVGVCQFFLIKAKRGTYLHVRHGPVLRFYDQTFTTIIDYLKQIAKQKKASFIRFSPLLKKTPENEAVFSGNSFIVSPIHRMDGEVCWVLPLDKNEEELLMQMRKTHRYLIRKAQKMSIEIVRAKNISDIEDFMYIYNDLAQRKHFVPHKGVKEEFDEFNKEKKCIFLLAKYNGKTIAGALVVFTPKMAIYRHGASLDAFRDIPASYLLQWEAIKEAKKRKMELYNFWGIAPFESKNHPWQGLTLFKTGFGGQLQEFVHAHDIGLNLLYWKTYCIELLTKYKKGY